jgi:ADP-ribosylglycohydrolase
MTVCLAESLLAGEGNDARDQMERYLRWTREGVPAGSGAPMDVPAAVKRALATWQWSRKPLAGSHDPKNHDPHSLARTAAVVLTRRTSAEQAIELAAEVSRTTQQSPVVLDACRLFAAFLFDLLAGQPKADVFSGKTPALQALRRGREARPSIEQLLTGTAARKNNAIPSNDDVVKVLAGALHAFEESSQFAAGLRRFTEGPQISASTAVVYAALAGAQGGMTQIPAELIAALQHRGFLEAMATRFQQ